MKRLVLSAAMCALVGVLLSGCQPKPAAPKPVKKTVKAKPEPKAKAKPVKQPKAVQAGNLDYLDSKYGFRDVTFGTSITAFDNLTPVGEDPARNLKTYTRAGDELTLGAVPLEKIEYSFYDDKLCQITVHWKIAYPAQSARTPPTTEVPAFCGTLYGHPTRHNVNKDSTFYVWHGRRAGVMISETRAPGVADVVKSGWSIPPTTIGQMVIYSRPLERTSNATTASQTVEKSGGL